MPYGTVNLRHGVPKGETTVTCTAGVGTFLIEFGTLSRLIGDPVFEKVAVRALRALWNAKSSLDLVREYINLKAILSSMLLIVLERKKREKKISIYDQFSFIWLFSVILHHLSFNIIFNFDILKIMDIGILKWFKRSLFSYCSLTIVSQVFGYLKDFSQSSLRCWGLSDYDLILLFYWQVGNHIDVATGKWTALDSGIGGGIDSYFEYLVKGAIMFDIPELLEHFRGKITEFFRKCHEFLFHLNYTRLCTYIWWKEIFPLRKGFLLSSLCTFILE